MPAPGDERLADWLDGRMTPRELERFEAEMRVSKPLREKAEAYRRTAEAVKDAFSVGGPKIDVTSAVLARLADPHGGKPAADRGTEAPAGGPAVGGAATGGGRVLAFPRSLPSAWILSSLVACAMVALVLLLDRWQPPMALESAALESARVDADQSRSASAPPAPAAPGAADPSASSAAGAGDLYYLGRANDGSGTTGSDSFHQDSKDASRIDPAEVRLQSAEPEGSSRDQVKQESNDATSLREGLRKMAADSPSSEAVPEANGALGFGSTAPIQAGTPRTAVPTVRLLRPPEGSNRETGLDKTAEQVAPDTGGAEMGIPRQETEAKAKARAAVPPQHRGGAAPEQSGLLAGALELDRALGNVQVYRLPTVPGQGVAQPDPSTARLGIAGSQAWVVEGPAADVQAFLATLSDAGRQRGYEIVNGEISVAELQAVDPSLPAVPGARFVLRQPAGGGVPTEAKDQEAPVGEGAKSSSAFDVANERAAASGAESGRSGTQAPSADERKLGNPETRRLGDERSATPGAGPQSPGAQSPTPQSSTPQGPDPVAPAGGRARGRTGAGPGGAPPGEPTASPHPTGTAPETGTSANPERTPAGAGVSGGGGGGAMLVMPVRVVVVIDPVK